MQADSKTFFPALPLDEWEPTKDTLHLWLQIVGKVRLALFPKKNHWWHAPLYVGARGLTTRPIPYEEDVFEITLDFLNHRLALVRSDGRSAGFALEDGLSTACFYEKTFAALSEIGVEAEIKAEPFDCFASGRPFSACDGYASYDRAAIERFWRVLVQVSGVFEEFGGRFAGKSTPVHLFWHSFDLALTRFSGRKAPPMNGEAGRVAREAYSHEVISFGFWAGDKEFRKPAFYAYTYPLSDGLVGEPIKPDAAYWGETKGNPQALLAYDDLRAEADPREALLSFLESVYQVSAKRAGWDTDAFALESAVA